MQKIVTTFVAAVFLLVGLAPMAQAAPQDGTMGFGMDIYSLKGQKNAGVKPDYATIWVGPWNLEKGWESTDRQLEKARKADVTPVIHLYYWGDDISPKCVRDGCWSSLHGTWKDQAGWNKLTRQLVNHLDKQMWGRDVVVVLETEFNKGKIQEWEPMDYRLKKKANYLHNHYPNAHVVLGLGNWNPGAWGTFDRAAKASDAVGLQAMRGSTRDSDKYYKSAFEKTLSGARKAKAEFGKPVFITDVALSSYPGPKYTKMQAAELEEFFVNMPALKKAGVEAVIYRSWRNSDMDNANYYGKAEDYWGLHKSGGDAKPAAKVWKKAVKVERGEKGPLDASFGVKAKRNNHWQEVAVDSNLPVWKVQVKDDDNWKRLPETSWGTYAKDIHIDDGERVRYRVISSTGEIAKSGAYTQR